MVTVRKGLLEAARDRLDATDRELVMTKARLDTAQVDLWKCEATKPTPLGMFNTFEVGMAVGSLLVMLIIWALDAQLE